MDTKHQTLGLPPGTKLFGYEIVQTIGTGSFGIVYRALKQGLGDVVAIKEFFPSQLARRREDGRVEPLADQVDKFNWSLDKFRQEAETLHQLAQPPHPSLVKVELVFDENNTVYRNAKPSRERPPPVTHPPHAPADSP